MHRPFRNQRIHRFLALVLAVLLSLPHPALALREIQTVDSGLEERELTEALVGRSAPNHPAVPEPTAGMEEEVVAKAKFQILPNADERELSTVESAVINDLKSIGTAALFTSSPNFSLDVGADRPAHMLVYASGEKLLFGFATLPLREVVRNAIDAIADRARRLAKQYEGVVEARVGRTELGEWFIELSDNGTGIPQGVLQRLFSTEVTTKDSSGASLGGSGSALFRGIGWNEFMEAYRGIVQVETLTQGESNSRVLTHDRGTSKRSFSQGQRTQVGTTVRFIFRDDPTQSSGAGLEERVPGWLEATLGADWMEVVTGVHEMAQVTDKVAVLIQPELLGVAEDDSEIQVAFMSMEGNLHGAFGWTEQTKLRLGLLTPQSVEAFEAQGYRVIRVVRHPESEETPLPWEAIPIVVAEALAGGQPSFWVNVTPYLNLKGITLPEILSTLTDLFA